MDAVGPVDGRHRRWSGTPTRKQGGDRRAEEVERVRREERAWLTCRLRADGMRRHGRERLLVRRRTMKNPIAGWSDCRIGVLFGAWLVLSIAGSLAICWSDRSLITSVYQRSQQLELTSSSACASCIVSDWNDRRCSDCIHIARRGIWIDTLWFVPAYSTLLALCCFWIGKHAGGSALLAPAALLGWASWSAGLLDWIENAGMLAQLRS